MNNCKHLKCVDPSFFSSQSSGLKPRSYGIVAIDCRSVSRAHMVYKLKESHVAHIDYIKSNHNATIECEENEDIHRAYMYKTPQ